MIIACILSIANAQCEQDRVCAVDITTGKKQTFESDCAMNDATINGKSKFQSTLT